MTEMQFRFQFNRRLKRHGDWERFNYLLDHDGERVKILCHDGEYVLVEFDDGRAVLIFNSELQAE